MTCFAIYSATYSAASSARWADFYLVCFAVGFCFSFFSFLFGGARTGRLHLPHFHGQVGGAHLPSASGPVAHGPVGHGQVAGDAHAAADGSHAQPSGGVSPFNFVTLTAFLAWFGGTGYLLTRYSGLWVGFGLLASAVSGLLAAVAVFLFLSKVLISEGENMDSADYEMVGVLGRVSSSIREGGTGEMVYTQMGTRRVCGARCDDGSAIAKETEVVVTRYEKGIAYVRLWSEMSGEE
jgi:membrane protein implicated in regulation of membrane protease activity